MTAHLRREAGKKALEKFRSGKSDFLRASCFESHSFIGYLKNENHKKELTKVATSPDTHPDNRALAWHALGLMNEPIMK